MERALKVLNSLEETGILQRYAIGGAMAALFYTEPVVTFDLDVFAVLPASTSGLITLQPLYEALSRMGYRPEGEGVLIEGQHVQFLPAYNPLLEEALNEAVETVYGAITTRVLRAEHLMAVMLQTGRGKDRQRFLLFRESVVFDAGLMDELLCRYELRNRWEEWTS